MYPIQIQTALTWVEMEEDVDEVLVAPGDIKLVLLEVGHDVFLPFRIPHPRQIHQHHARVDTFTTTITNINNKTTVSRVP